MALPKLQENLNWFVHNGNLAVTVASDQLPELCHFGGGKL